MIYQHHQSFREIGREKLRNPDVSSLTIRIMPSGSRWLIPTLIFFPQMDELLLYPPIGWENTAESTKTTETTRRHSSPFLFFSSAHSALNLCFCSHKLRILKKSYMTADLGRPFSLRIAYGMRYPGERVREFIRADPLDCNSLIINLVSNFSRTRFN